MGAVTASAPSSVSQFHQEHNMYGKLTFPDGMPLINRTIAVYAHLSDWVRFKVREFRTNKDGEYVTKVSCLTLPGTKQQKFVFQILNRTLPWYGHPSTDRVVDEIGFSKPIDSTPHGPRIRPTQLLAYESGGLPLTRTPTNKAWQAERWPLYDNYLFYKGVIPGFIQSLRFKVGTWKIEDYIKALGKKELTFGTGDNATIQHLLRGICRVQWKKVPGSPEELKADLIWDRYEQDKVGPKLPNAGIVVKVSDDNMSIVRVWTHYKGYDRKEAKPGDENYENIRYSFNSSALVEGQCTTHLTEAHFAMDQISTAKQRFILEGKIKETSNPLWGMISPHLRETHVIDSEEHGRKAIAGQGGALDMTGLTIKGIPVKLEDALAASDYLDFSPREAMYSGDNFAHLQKEWWDAFSETVDKLFERDMPQILEHWNETYLFSECLHRHSPAFRHRDGTEDLNEYHDPSEFYNPNAPKRVADPDGVIRSIRRITTVRENPSQTEINNLKQLVKYVWCSSMLRHSIFHDSQGDFGDLRFAALAPQGNGEGPFAGMKKEHALRQARFANALTKIDEADEQSVLNNPHKDILPEVLETLESLRGSFKKYGFDINSIRPSVDL